MKKSLGLLGCAFFLTCAGAEAAPITYDIDQAFWGQYSATTLYTALREVSAFTDSPSIGSMGTIAQAMK